ncbi:inositol polyphosphate multikinase [Notechis scutatus]|uniref:Kinase n=1 Tax=Notechis scutatus TaxID=8663 RepID=A0A6J1VIC6_9SAUR|nr:inositol polyphosphate multikinase [Notechis scutatus]
MATEPPRRVENREAERLERLPGSAPAGATAAANGKEVEATMGLLDGCVPLSHQVAGHMFGKDKGGILQHPDGTVLKQLQPPPRGPRELDFYNKVFADGCEDSVFLELQKYLPKYYGTWSLPTAPNDLYLKLEDVTHRFKKPCIMDVKIGQKSYDPYASEEKIKQQISKYPLMEEIGFLVLGMRVYHAPTGSYETQNQHYGRGLTKETIKDGVARFFYNGFTLRKDAIAVSIEKIKEILHWFENQKQLNFYASSLLFVYDGWSPWLNDGCLVEKNKVAEDQVPSDSIDNTLECNNNIHIINASEMGEVETSDGKDFSKTYTFHNRHQNQFLLRDHLWKRSSCFSQKHLNGNVIPQLEKVFSQMPMSLPGNGEVEVRMIDFAHVFPSDARDEGYIYGLKNLITVLQNILDT